MKPGVRVSGGEWKGRRLSVLPGVRPSTAVVREALASRWLPSLAGARVLDLYSGSGVMILEFLGRGAASVTAIEGSSKAARRLHTVIPDDRSGDIVVICARLPAAMNQLSGRFDLVFADPPYELEDLQPLLGRIADRLSEQGEVAIESAVERALPDGVVGTTGAKLRLHDSRRYGDSRLSLYQPG